MYSYINVLLDYHSQLYITNTRDYWKIIDTQN